MSFKNKYSFPKNRKVILCWLLPIQFIVYKLISLFPKGVEQFYSNGLFIPISKTLRLLTGWISVPVGQLLVISATCYITYLIVKIIRSKQFNFDSFKQYALNIIAALSVIYFAFMTLWGLNYSRQSLTDILNYDETISTSAELVKVCEIIIDKTNTARKDFSKDENTPINFEIEWSKMIDNCNDGFENISKNQPEFTYSHTSVKEAFVPQVMSYLGIGGIYFPFTGEANVNTDLPSYLVPFTTCHEMAHQIGFAKEDEANFVSYLVCVNHTDKKFRYSGYLAMLKYATSELRYQDYDKYELIRTRYSKGLITDLEYNRNYWEKFETPLVYLSSDINDMYLKANNQEGGVDSYNLVVQLLIKQFRKEGSL